MIDQEPKALVGRIWNWIPAFRAVAETEHLPSASEILFVSPSALSRTIGLLEKELGQPLFIREGRRLRLNTSGERLLARVRDSMRLVHDGVLDVRDETLVGPLRILSLGVITPVHVEPVLERMRALYPSLTVYLRTIPTLGIVDDLLRGTVDLVLQSVPVAHKHVETIHLGEETNGVYCGPGHPLFGESRTSIDDISKHAFIAPVPDAHGRSNDGWPLGLARRVVLFTDHMAAGIRACAQGRLLAVLPDAIAGAQGLERLPMNDLPTAPMFAMRRRRLADVGRVDRFLDHLRTHIDR